MGIEPTQSAWKAEVLPLNYTRIVFRCIGHPFAAHLAACRAHKAGRGRKTLLSPPPQQRRKFHFWWRGEDSSTPPAFRPSGRRAARDVLGAARPRQTSYRFASSPARAWRTILLLVEGGGFEPPKAEPSDLQSDPFDRSGTPPKKRRYSLATSDDCQPMLGRFRFPAPQDARKHVLASPLPGSGGQLPRETAVRPPHLI